MWKYEGRYEDLQAFGKVNTENTTEDVFLCDGCG